MLKIDKTKYLSEGELAQLECKLSLLRDINPRNCLLIDMALATGARASELLNLTVDCIFQDSQSILIKGLKGSNDREIPLNPELFKRLQKQMPESGKVFDISYKRLFQLWHGYRVTPKKFHALRHSFAIQTYKKTKDIKLVQILLGHKCLTNTQVYVDFVYNQEQVRRILFQP